MATPNPKISVITPSLNHARFLEETIESIAGQSCRAFEHIVVDGGSQDNTIDVLKRHPHIKWISEKDESITEAFRKGFDMSRGEYIIQCCVSDGFLDKDWFQRCVDVLEGDSDVSLVWGLPQYMSEDGRLSVIAYAELLDLPVPQKTDFLPFWLATGFLFPEGNYCIRRGVFDLCFPHPRTETPFWRHPALGLVYEFNTQGYLPCFLPVVANYGRVHQGQRSQSLIHIERPIEREYHRSVKTYRTEFLRGRTTHHFRNGGSEAIKAVEAGELKGYRKKTRAYRLERSVLWRANLAMLARKVNQYGPWGLPVAAWRKLRYGA